MKKILNVLFVLGAVLLVSGGVFAETIFSEGFEDGIIEDGNWTISDGTPSITGDLAISETYSLLLNASEGKEKIISVNLSVEGYKNIQFSYLRETDSLAGGADFKSWYSFDGGAWQNPETLTGTNSVDTTEVSLGNGFENVSLIFRVSSGGSGFAIVDNVLITGTEAIAPIIEDIVVTPAYPKTTDTVEICGKVTDNSNLNKVRLDCSSANHAFINYDMTLAEEDIYCSYFSADFQDQETMDCTINATDEYDNSNVENVSQFTFDGNNPVADADGPYPCNEGETISLNASTSWDSVDSSLDYAWDLDDDGAYDDAFVVNPSFLCVDDGDYPVSVQVTDDAGFTDTADSVVTVSNVDPVAYANGPYSGDEGSEVLLSASATDDGVEDTLTYVWDLDNDGIFETSGKEVSFNCIDDSVNTTTVKVTDGDGGSSTDSAIVTCNNVAPEVNAGEDQAVDEGELVTINPSFSDVGINDVHTAVVDWAGVLHGLGTVTSPFSYSDSFCDEGSYVVEVSVTDDDFGVGSDSLTVIVNNVAPTFDNLPASSFGVVGDLFSYDVDASDVGCDTLIYSLSGEPDGMIIDSDTGLITWTPTESQDGDYVVTVIVDDGTDSIEANLSIHVFDYAIELSQGWNLISIPLVPEEDNTSINNVFGGEVSSRAEKIWSYSYDTDTDKNVWNYNEPLSDGSRWKAYPSRIQDIIPGYGYYLLMNEEAINYQNGERYYGISDSGSLPMPPQVELTTGWNLIGHYGMNNVDKTDEVQDLSGGTLTNIADITLLNKDAVSVNQLNPTQGYWAFVTGQNNLWYAPSEADYS